MLRDKLNATKFLIFDCYNLLCRFFVFSLLFEIIKKSP